MNLFIRIFVNIFCGVSVGSLCACSSNESLEQVLAEYATNIERDGQLTSLDLRSYLPIEWEKVCIGYFPYASKAMVEEKLQGKIISKFENGNDSRWMLLGISGKGEITQVELDDKISILFGKHFRAPARYVCVARQQALLTATTDGRNIRINLGNRLTRKLK